MARLALSCTRPTGFGVLPTALVVVVVLASACGSDSAGGARDSTSASTIAAAVTTGAPLSTVSPDIAPTTTTALEVEVGADDIPVAFTPAGGWTDMPPPVLATCTEPLVDDAPDMRGTWEVVSVDVDGADDPAHDAIGEVQRIEQCGDRVVITAGGIVHDMRADGTVDGGVHDVAALDKTTPISAVATFENGVHVLRPVGVPVEVTRMIDGDQLVWGYVGFVARLDRVSDSTG